MLRGTWIAIGVALLALSGCNTVPVVQYSEIKEGKPAVNITDSFYLARSDLSLTVTVTEDKNKRKSEDFALVSKPAAFEDFKVGIRPSNSMRVTTKINLKKIENSDLVSEVGVETTDNTAALIGQIGGVIVKTIGLVAAAVPGGGGPCIVADKSKTVKLDLSVSAAAFKSGKAFNVQFTPAGGGQNCINVAVGAVAKEAVRTMDDAGATIVGIPTEKDTSNFYYSACRDVTVTFRHSGEEIERRARIADPTYVQYVQMPYKGTVVMHSQCGVSVKTEATSPQNGVSIADALVTQAKAIKDAIEASK